MYVTRQEVKAGLVWTNDFRTSPKNQSLTNSSKIRQSFERFQNPPNVVTVAVSLSTIFQFDTIMTRTRVSTTFRRVSELLLAIEMMSLFLHERSGTRSAESLRVRSRRFAHEVANTRQLSMPRNWDTCRMIHYAASNLAGDFPPRIESGNHPF